MNGLTQLYVELIIPTSIIEYFKTDEEFKSWCETGDVDDLTYTLKVFENYELYEHCAIIKNVIDEKIDDISLSSAL
jgi:ABC-type histidine transport system ATPase subunit